MPSINQFLVGVLIACVVIGATCWCILRFHCIPKHRRFTAELRRIQAEEGWPRIVRLTKPEPTIMEEKGDGSK